MAVGRVLLLPAPALPRAFEGMVDGLKKSRLILLAALALCLLVSAARLAAAPAQAGSDLTGFFARLPLLTLLQLVFGILFFEVIQ